MKGFRFCITILNNSIFSFVFSYYLIPVTMSMSYFINTSIFDLSLKLVLFSSIYFQQLWILIKIYWVKTLTNLSMIWSFLFRTSRRRLIF